MQGARIRRVLTVTGTPEGCAKPRHAQAASREELRGPRAARGPTPRVVAVDRARPSG